MRLIAILLFSSVLIAGSASAETAAPIFGGSATGAFQVADQQADKTKNPEPAIHAANDCTSPDCTGSVKPANLPTSGKKP